MNKVDVRLTAFIRHAGVAGVLAVVLLISGCADHRRNLDACYRAAQAGNFESALAGLDRSPLASSSNNRLLYLMEKGVLLHLDGQYRQSNQALEEADRLAEELFTRRISAETMSLVSSDNIIPYAGEDFESGFIHYYKARNYLALGQVEDARIEARKIDEKLNWFAGRGGEFKENAFLRLLTGLIYEGVEDWNDAFIAYRKSLDEYGHTAAPELLWGRLLLTARRTGFLEEYDRYREKAAAAGRNLAMDETVLAVIVDRGFAPVKREVFALIPTVHGFPVKLALPEFHPRSSGIAGPVEISLDGRDWVPAELVEDVGDLSRRALEDRKGRVLAKMVARAVAKQVAARKIEKEMGPLAGLAAQIAALATEQADLRSWTMLPDQVLVALIPVEPGRHSVTIRHGGRKEVHSVVVEERGVGFVVTRM